MQIAVEIETFDSGMIRNGLRLIGEGLMRGPGFWQLCLGVPGGAAPDLQTIGYLLSRLPEGALWSMLGIGRHQLEVNVLSLLYGGHVRTGLEDNVYYRRGELARSNAQLVERVVRLADEFGRPVASPARSEEAARNSRASIGDIPGVMRKRAASRYSGLVNQSEPVALSDLPRSSAPLQP